MRKQQAIEEIRVAVENTMSLMYIFAENWLTANNGAEYVNPANRSIRLIQITSDRNDLNLIKSRTSISS